MYFTQAGNVIVSSKHACGTKISARISSTPRPSANKAAHMCPLKGRFLDIFTIYITSGTKEFFEGKHDAGVRKVVSNLYIYPKTESCWRGGGVIFG